MPRIPTPGRVARAKRSEWFVPPIVLPLVLTIMIAARALTLAIPGW